MHMEEYMDNGTVVRRCCALQTLLTKLCKCWMACQAVYTHRSSILIKFLKVVVVVITVALQTAECVWDRRHIVFDVVKFRSSSTL